MHPSFNLFQYPIIFFLLNVPGIKFLVNSQNFKVAPQKTNVKMFNIVRRKKINPRRSLFNSLHGVTDRIGNHQAYSMAFCFDKKYPVPLGNVEMSKTAPSPLTPGTRVTIASEGCG
jgi:hypothetical protein